MKKFLPLLLFATASIFSAAKDLESKNLVTKIKQLIETQDPNWHPDSNIENPAVTGINNLLRLRTDHQLTQTLTYIGQRTKNHMGVITSYINFELAKRNKRRRQVAESIRPIRPLARATASPKINPSPRFNQNDDYNRELELALALSRQLAQTSPANSIVKNYDNGWDDFDDELQQALALSLETPSESPARMSDPTCSPSHTASSDQYIYVCGTKHRIDLLDVTDPCDREFLTVANLDWCNGKAHLVCQENPVFQRVINRFTFLNDDKFFIIVHPEQSPIRSSSACE